MAVSVTVSPTVVSLTAGGSQQFAATVTGAGNTGVNWSISPSVGSVSFNGTYVVPAIIASYQNITVTATSLADPSKFATASIALLTAPYVMAVPGGYLSCNPGDPQAQAVVLFSPGLAVSQGSIILSAGQALPPVPYQQWTPPYGFWVATSNINLPSSQPPFGSGTDSLRFVLPEPGAA